ncbi:MAG: sugar MFS transporter [Melioribacteraceae bacterium]
MASIATTSNNNRTTESGQNYNFALTVLTSLFFMWGFITCLNDILIPHLKAIFTLNYTQVMLIQFSFFTAYAIISIPAGMMVEKIGYKNGIVIGLITAGIGCLLFYPAAGIQSYYIFLGSLFVLASGITILQVAANPYVAILGKPETASSRLNLTQAFNSVGTTIAPYLGSLIILSLAVKTAVDFKSMSPEQISVYKLAESSAVQVPYLGLAAALFVIAAVFAVIKLPRIEASEVKASGDEGVNYHDMHKSAWGYKHLVFGAIAIFLYVGGEVSIGSFLVNYIGQPFIAGLKESDAGKYVSLYWGGAMIGRFFGSILLSGITNTKKKNIFSALVFILAIILSAVVTDEYKNLSDISIINFSRTLTFLLFVVVNFAAFNFGLRKPARTLTILAICAACLVVASMLTFGAVAMWTILAVGMFNSIMFPTIFTLAIDGLGKHTGQASGILCTAIVGGAILPVVQGFFADNIGIHHAFFIPVLCYIYIAYYGLKGHKPSYITVKA